jgi:Ca2+-binding RTX toxin-like protein
MATLRTYSATVEQFGALMHLRLNEASGTDAIDSAGTLDGEYQGGVERGVAGIIGNGAVLLDGANEQIFFETLSGTLTVSAFGDSLIDGVPAFQPEGQDFSPVLEAGLDARGLNATVVNDAVAGQRSGQGLDRVDEIVNADPDVVIVEFGTNDAILRVDQATVESNLDGIIDALRAADIEVLLTGAFAFYPDRGATGAGYTTELERDAFEQIFPDLAIENGVTLLRDADGSFQFLGGSREGAVITGGVLGDPALQAIVSGNPDGLHPNPLGVQQIVPRVMPQTIALGAAAGVVNEALPLASGSFEIWFSPNAVNGSRTLFSKNGDGQGTGGHLAVLIQDGEIMAALGDGTTDRVIQSTSLDLQAGQLHHLVFTFGAAGMQLFVDGQAVAVTGSGLGYTGGLTAGMGNFEPLVVGSDAGTNHFWGVIDEFAVYDGALSPGQIASLFAAGQGGLTLAGTPTDDQIFGGVDNEELRGADGNDTLSGAGGDDILRGADENDGVSGGDGADLLFGGFGLDELVGGAANDSLFGGPGADTGFGGPGDDRLDGEGGADVLAGGPGNDVLIGGLGGDRLTDGGGNDRLEGTVGVDELVGGEGDDQLFGNIGPDTLRGGPGDDLLVGGYGFDTLVGGGGSDTFSIDVLAQGIDRILDFQAGLGGDILDMRNLLSFQDGDAIGDFVQLSVSGNNTAVSANPTGTGGNFTPVFNLVGVTGLDVDNLLGDGNLQVA